MEEEIYYDSNTFFNGKVTFFGDVTLPNNTNFNNLTFDNGFGQTLSINNGIIASQVGGASTSLIVRGNSLLSGITTVSLGSTSSPQYNSHMSFELTTDTNLRVKVRGSDGVLRSGNIPLA